MSEPILGEDGLRETSHDANPGKRKKRNRWALFTVLGLLAAVLIAGVAVVTWYGTAVNDALSSMKRDDSLMPVDGEDPDGYVLPDGKALKPGEKRDGKVAPVNVLILGSDSRGADRGRSDVFMLAHIAGDRKTVHLISIPRDYWVQIPGKSTAKINAAYSWGGAPLSVSTVQRLLGVRIDHVAITDFQGYENAIDAIGGVSVYNKQASENQGFSWPEGMITLPDGREARAFVQQRYGLDGGDFDRSERQREVVMAVFDKLTSRGVLADPLKFRDAVTTIGPNFTVDDGLTNQRMIDVAMSLGFEGSSNIRSIMAPTAGFGTSSDGQSYVKVDEARLAELGQALRDDEMDGYYTGR